MTLKNINLNSLGEAQREVELAAKDLKAKQISFTKASDSLKAADERYLQAIQNLNLSVDEVRTKTKVLPLGV